MHNRRLVKRSVLGSRVYASSPTGDGAPVTGVVQAVKQESAEDAGARRGGNTSSVYTVLLPDGSLKEFAEDEITSAGLNHTKGPLKSSLKSSVNGGQHGHKVDGPEATESDRHETNGKRMDAYRSVSLLEQKRKVVSSSIDVPHARRSEEEVDMDKVTAAMVLTSLSTSPLVRSPPVKVNEALSGSWKENGSTGLFTPSSNGSSGGYWSWSAPSDQSNPSTPSPPLSADSFKPFRVPSGGHPNAGTEDPSLEETDGSSLLFDEPIPRKRKNSMKVMFKCLWKNCGKVLSTAAGIQRHIRTIHLGRSCDSDCSDGEEDFYYTEIKLNTDTVAEGLSSLSPMSPSVLTPPPQPDAHVAAPVPLSPLLPPPCTKEPHSGSVTPLSRSAPSALYFIHADHAYQATPPVSIPSNGATNPAASYSFTPTNSSGFSISWQSPPLAFTGNRVSPSKSQGFADQRSQTITVLSSPPRATAALSRKVRSEGKKCRKVYGMENRDMWCTACRWKKACQRFTD
ncbi:zinc finger protein 704 isoform X2 [Syngnathus scovelli]|uniref:zinc finger protein 704 isoform X2 n=1 Tax=Syngnathus scovelli TaxID=161590 RepID=UPI0021101E34|nr:zinc finger protein 704 isoform X2 [Syngnathus scovelli]